MSPSRPCRLASLVTSLTVLLLASLAIAACGSGDPSARFGSLATGRELTASQVVFTVQPASTTAGAALAAISVAVQDGSGNVVTTAAGQVQLALIDPAAQATLAGTASVAAVKGVATFKNLSIARAGTYMLSATFGSLAGATSDAFTISPGVATKLTFLQQPIDTLPGQPIAPAVSVGVLDSHGNAVLSSSAVVTLTLGGAGSATLANANATALNGVATFPALSIDKAGNSYTLLAASPGLSSVRSTVFAEPPPGTPWKLAFSVQPASGTAGTALAAISVAVEDSLGALVPSSAAPVSLTLSSNAGALLGTTTVAASGGVATFSDLSVALAGSYKLTASSGALLVATSATFSIAAGAAAQASFTVEPGDVLSRAHLSPAVRVTLLDAEGNVATGSSAAISIALGNNPSGATLSGTTTVNAYRGVASFSSLSIDLVGAGYTLVASADGATPVTSTPFSVAPAAAAKIIAVSGAGQGGGTGTTLAQPLVVKVTDAAGNPIPGNTVTWTAPAGASISPATSITAADGTAQAVATLGTAPGNETFKAAGTGFTATASFAQAVVAGAGASLVFTSSPAANVTAGNSLGTIRVAAKDAFGNSAAQFTGAVSLGLAGGASGPALSGVTTVNAVAGVATFTGVTLTAAAQGYALTASSPNLTGAVGSAFNIIAAAAKNLAALSGQNQSALVGTALPAPLIVGITDRYGNPVLNSSVNWTAVTGKGSVAPATTVTASDGTTQTIATVGPAAGANTFTAVHSGLIGSPVTFTGTGYAIGPPAALAFIQQPLDAIAGAAIAPAITVSVVDAHGNVVAGSTIAISIALQANPNGATLHGTTQRSASGGVATFDDLSLDKAGPGATLIATANGLGSATSSPFAIAANEPGIPVLAQAEGTLTHDGLVVSWTEPGAHGTTGTLASQSLCYLSGAACAGSPAPAAFLAGTCVQPAVGAPGDAQSVDFRGQLSAETDYCFLLEVSNAGGNLADSNVLQRRTVDDVAPSAPVLSAVVEGGTILLNWTDVGDDGQQGLATSATLYVGNTTSTCPASFAQFNNLTTRPLPAPQAAGTAEQYAFVAPPVIQCFQVVVTDDAGNSGASNVVSAQAVLGPGPAAITGLVAILFSHTQVALDFRPSASAVAYDARAAFGGACPLTESSFYSGTQLTGTLSPNGGDVLLTATVSDTDSLETCYAVKAIAADGTVSSISNVATPPARAADFALTSKTGTSATFSWTAVGSTFKTGAAAAAGFARLPSADGTCPAASFDLFVSAQITGAPQPDLAGTPQTGTVGNLTPNSLYCVGLVVIGDDRDANYSFSPLVLVDTTVPTPATVTPTLGAVTSSTATLTFTAVGDEGQTGASVLYEVAFTPGAGCASNLTAGRNVTGFAIGDAAGTAEAVTLTGLSPGTHYCALVFALNAEGGRSLQAAAPLEFDTQGIVPDAIADLRAILEDSSSVLLTFTAPAVGGARVAAYDVRYLQGTACPVTASNFAQAHALTVPLPQSPGSAEHDSVVIDGAATQQLCIAVQAVSAGVEAPISNIATPPAPIVDLAVLSVGSNSASVHWTAVGAAFQTGAAASYVWLYENAADFGGACPTDAATFYGAGRTSRTTDGLPVAPVGPPVLGPGAAAVAGSSETGALINLEPGTSTCAMLEALNADGSASFSNVVQVTTPVDPCASAQTPCTVQRGGATFARVFTQAQLAALLDASGDLASNVILEHDLDYAGTTQPSPYLIQHLTAVLDAQGSDGRNHALQNWSGFSPIAVIAAGAFVNHLVVSGVDVHLADADQEGDWSGGLAAFNHGTIQNCSVTGQVVDVVPGVGSRPGRGGVVGHNFSDGQISGCTATVTVTGGGRAGGLVGVNDGALTACTANGAVTGPLAGGLAGENRGTIALSGATGSVTGGMAGGLVGVNDGAIALSSATGAVSCTGSACGGFFAITGEACWSINSCTASGAVTSTQDYVGGFGGRIQSACDTIDSSHSSGNVLAGGVHSHSFLGLDGGAQITSSGGTGQVFAQVTCYGGTSGSGTQTWDGTTLGVCQLNCDSGNHVSPDGTSCDADQRACTDDFANGLQLWNPEAQSYGACVISSCNPAVADLVNGACVFKDACINAASPCQGTRLDLNGASATFSLVFSPAQLVAWVAANQGGNLVLEQDLDFTGVAPFSGSVIGSVSGQLDGRGHTVSNFTAQSFIGNIGLGAVVTNLTIDSAQVTVAGLASSSSGTLSHVNVSYSTVTSSNQYAAGLVRSLFGALSHCRVDNVQVLHANQAGGVAEYVSSTGSIDDCVALAVTITGKYSLGGMVGQLQGAVTGSTVAGATITGEGTPDPSELGGFVGYVQNPGTVSGCEAHDVQVTGGVNVGGFVGRLDRSTISNSKVEVQQIPRNLVQGTGVDLEMGGFVGYVMSDSPAASITGCSVAFTDVSNTDGDSVGGFIGGAQGAATFSADSVNDVTVKGRYELGGFAGMSQHATFGSCSVSNVAVDGNATIGQFIGHSTGSVVDGTDTATAVTTTGIPGATHVGGFIGWGE